MTGPVVVPVDGSPFAEVALPVPGSVADRVLRRESTALVLVRAGPEGSPA